MDRINEKNSNGLPIWLLTTAVLAIASVRLAPLALLLPFVLACTAARFGIAGGVAGAAALGAAAVLSAFAALMFAAAFLPGFIAAAVAIRRKWRFRDSVMITSGAALTGAVLCVALLWLLRGMMPAELAAQRAQALLASLDDRTIGLAYQFLRTPDIWTGAVTQQAVQSMPGAQAGAEMVDMLRQWVSSSLVAAMLVYALLWGLLGYLAARHSAAKHGVSVQAIPDFSDYALPGRFWLAFALSYLAAAAADSYGLVSSRMLQPTVASAYAITFIVQALAFTDFFYKARGMSRSRRVAMHTTTVLLFGSYLMWLGVLENIVRLRSREQENGGGES